MSSSNHLSGFWRLWIVLSATWIAVIYVEDRFYQRWQLDYLLTPIFYPPIDVDALNRAGILVPFDDPYGRPLIHLIALGGPVGALVIVALVLWITNGFKRRASG